MNSSDLQISPNGARNAGPRCATEIPAGTGAAELCASKQILEAHRLLRELTLRDDLAFGSQLLLAAVAEGIDKVATELVSLAGLQKRFELWLDTAE